MQYRRCSLITRYVRTPKTRKCIFGNPTAGAVSLRLGHAAGLTVPRTVIQYRVAASLPRRSLRGKAYALREIFLLTEKCEIFASQK